MRSNRDRAILALAISTAARASELLGMRGGDLDWGDQLIRVRRKGTGAEQWLPASPEAFVWLRLYLAEIGELAADEPVWWTLRRRAAATGRYAPPAELRGAAGGAAPRERRAGHELDDARPPPHLRAADGPGRRAVAARHADDPRPRPPDHDQIYLEDDDTEVIRRVHQHLANREEAARTAPAAGADRDYDAADLAVLFGGTVR